MSRENPLSSNRSAISSTGTSSCSTSTSTKPIKAKSDSTSWSSVPHATSTEQIRKQIITDLVIANSPRITLQPIHLKSKANGLFGRVVLDAVVEPLFAACFDCKKILHFQTSHNGAGNLSRHLRSCPAQGKQARRITIPEEGIRRSVIWKEHGRTNKMKRNRIDEWFDKATPCPENKLLHVYSSTGSSDSSE